METLRKRIVPLADLLTPNRPEAELLAGMSIAGEEDMAEAGKDKDCVGCSCSMCIAQ